MLGNRFVATLLSLALLGSSNLVPSSQDPQKGAPFVLDVGEHDLIDFVNRAATYLGRNIFMDHAEVTALSGGAGSFEIQKRLEVDVPGCEELLSQMLYMKGFALIPHDTSKDMYEVVAVHGPKRAEILSSAIFMTPEQILERPNLKMPVLTSVPLEHIQVQVATNSLRPFFASSSAGPTLTLGNVGSNRAMLLQGFANQVAPAIRLLRMVDVPAPESPLQPSVEARIEALEKRFSELEAKHGDGR